MLAKQDRHVGHRVCVVDEPIQAERTLLLESCAKRRRPHWGLSEGVESCDRQLILEKQLYRGQQSERATETVPGDPYMLGVIPYLQNVPSEVWPERHGGVHKTAMNQAKRRPFEEYIEICEPVCPLVGAPKGNQDDFAITQYDAVVGLFCEVGGAFESPIRRGLSYGRSVTIRQE